MGGNKLVAPLYQLGFFHRQIGEGGIIARAVRRVEVVTDRVHGLDNVPLVLSKTVQVGCTYADSTLKIVSLMQVTGGG